MKKILVIVNDYHFPHNVLHCAVRLAKKENGALFGLFTQSLKRDDTDSYLFPSDINLTDTDFTSETDEQENLRLEQSLTKLFEDTCAVEGIAFQSQSIHENFLDTLIDHSAFADIIICDSVQPPVQYSLNSLLADAHAPVLLVPRDYTDYEKIIFTYDGGSSSMHAIRQFTYLFSTDHTIPVYLVSVLPVNIRDIEYSDLLKEWLPLHYPSAHIEILKGDSKHELPDFINRHEKAIVVMGAYGRSSLSRLFKGSLASIVLEKTSASLFITHD